MVSLIIVDLGDVCTLEDLGVWVRTEVGTHTCQLDRLRLT